MSTAAAEPETAPDTEPVADPDRDSVGLSRTASGDRVPSVRQRALRRLNEDPVVAWGSALIVAAIGFALRFWKVGESPKAFAFDEIYYAKDAWSMLNYGYPRNYVDGADQLILGGQTGPEIFKPDEVNMIVHPEVGKWLIALGEKAFGMDPFGWRIASVIVGSLMILVMARFVRRVTGSTLLGLLGGLLVALDGLQFTLSRLALLDIFVAFFLLCAVHCVVADRQWFRRKLAQRMPTPVPHAGWGPLIWWRPWLVLGGVMFGLACGTKWSALYPLAAFGILAYVWGAGARSSYGVKLAWLKSALTDGIVAFVSLVLVGVVVYISTWGSWLTHAHEFEKALGGNNYRMELTPDQKWPTAVEPDASGLGEVTQSLRSLWYYHQDVYLFHTQKLDTSTHPYQSKPLGWLLVNVPVGVDAQNGIQPGDQGCTAPSGSTCLKQVILIPTPVLWWGACLALLYSLVMWIGARDWRFGVAVVGTASTWLPWLQYDDRPIFIFYAICCLPFMVLALCLTAGKLIGASTVPTPRRTAGVVAVGTFTLLVLLNFWFFWPILTDQLITNDNWLSRMWIQPWIGGTGYMHPTPAAS